MSSLAHILQTDSSSHSLLQMYDHASSTTVYLILPVHSSNDRCTMDGTLWFYYDLFDIPCIGDLFGCDVITSWLVMKVINTKMKSDNTT
jgi:hypothetical protein